jgi:hypothetical protein
LIERAIAIEIASGKPSGIETIRITTAMIAIFPKFKSVSFEKISSLLLAKIKMKTKTECVKTLIMQAANE